MAYFTRHFVVMFTESIPVVCIVIVGVRCIRRVSASIRQVAHRDVMTSSKRDVAVSRLTSLLHEWDSGSKSVRRRILQDFVSQNQRKTSPELEAEFADAASLFFTRITSWLRLTYPCHR